MPRTWTRMRRKHWHDGDVAALVEVIVLLVWLRIALHLRPFRAVRGAVLSRARRASRMMTDGVLEDDRTLRRAMLRGARLLPGSKCLPQALAGLLFTARRGVRARVCIGVQVGNGEPFGAHAWLATARGPVIGDIEAAGFVPLVTFDPFASDDPAPAQH